MMVLFGKPISPLNDCKVVLKQSFCSVSPEPPNLLFVSSPGPFDMMGMGFSKGVNVGPALIYRVVHICREHTVSVPLITDDVGPTPHMLGDQRHQMCSVSPLYQA
ncbi:Hypothetical predicted protein [Xyrichtys novacula]|uniref:Uncharacterized protein n=1 Tax=Xyrichtys novacula TaxID=13765 RepID=A0AAV1GKY1_XYRNO|nr:Hypothetical predicted protein [Xyrichtys novacula]